MTTRKWSGGTSWVQRNFSRVCVCVCPSIWSCFFNALGPKYITREVKVNCFILFILLLLEFWQSVVSIFASSSCTGRKTITVNAILLSTWPSWHILLLHHNAGAPQRSFVAADVESTKELAPRHPLYIKKLSSLIIHSRWFDEHFHISISSFDLPPCSEPGGHEELSKRTSCTAVIAAPLQWHWRTIWISAKEN